MKQEEVKLTSRWIASDAVFNKFAIKFNILLIATLVLLRIIWCESEFIDIENFEISKITFREAMGVLASIMAMTYYVGCVRCLVDALLDSSCDRIDKELASIYGFLTLPLFLMNLFGFLGILWLLVSPPSLLLVQQFAKFRNVKESQD